MKQYMLLSSFLRRQTTTKSKWHFLDSCFARVFSLISSKWAKQDLCSLLIFRIKHLHCGAPSLQNDPFHVPVKHFSDPAEACRIISTVAVVYSMYCIKEKREALLILRSYRLYDTVCSGTGFVTAFRAVRTLLKASLKTITLNIIAVVTWAGKPHRVCCRD